MTYAEKLKDKRWEEKRFKALKKAKHTCKICKSTSRTLHIHHLKYHTSGDPWKSPFKDLICICDICHRVIHKTEHDTNFIKVQKACTDLLTEDLKATDGRLRLLFWFIKQALDNLTINQENILIAPIPDIAIDLEASEMSIRRWLKVLINRGYISQRTFNNKIIQSAFVLNKDLIYKGK